ncbi:MAG: phage baseplate assembly protein V [Rhodospirillales bacterium]|nr:phage baseplate assembly protein V [Rhodospirillales bacterium]
MEQFLNVIKAQAAALDRSQAQPRFGVVASVDSSRYAARVRLQPEDVLTGWLPILAPWVGAGWGMACPPMTGDQVLVLAHEGDAGNGVIVGRSYSDTARCPGAPPGELWLMHASGSYLRLQNDGTIRAQGDVHIAGNLFVSGDIQDRDGIVAVFRRDYNAHIHADPQGGTTAGPAPLVAVGGP